MNRANRAALYLLPKGHFKEAEQELAIVLDHFAASPGWLGQYLVFWCRLQTAKGNWTELRAGLTRLDEARAALQSQAENLSQHTRLWQTHYQLVQAIVARDQAQLMISWPDMTTCYCICRFTGLP